MSAETITTAIFLITAVVATAVLVNAIYPVIYTTAGTFQSSTHDADTRLRTDFKIVATFAKASDQTADVYMKNVGSQRISLEDINQSDIFCGKEVGTRLINVNVISKPGNSTEIIPADDSYWAPGETLHVHATTSITSNSPVYFQFVLPNGIWRSQEFNAAS